MKPRQIFSIILGIVVLSIVAIFGFLVLQSQVFAGFSEYEIAKQKWSKRTFSKYRLTVEYRYSSRMWSFTVTSCIYDVEVQDEKVLSTYPTDTCSPGPLTISDLFNWIKEYKPSATDDCATYLNCGCVGPVQLISKYDMSLGYPYSIKPQISSERRLLYPEFWMDLIGQKPCPPNFNVMTGGHEFEVKLLQPLP